MSSLAPSGRPDVRGSAARPQTRSAAPMRWDRDRSTTHSSPWWTGVPLRRLSTAADAGPIDGWIWSVAGGEWDDASCASLLDHDETSAMIGLPQPHRHAFLRNHAMMRVLLGEQQARHPQELALTRDGGGKPRFADPTDRHFNLSHSGSFGALGVGFSPVGVDIECPRHINYSPTRRGGYPSGLIASKTISPSPGFGQPRNRI